MNARAVVGRLRASGFWRPSAAAYLLGNAVPRRSGRLPSDEVVLRATARWLARAQDANGDGGIAGRYRLASGWSSSYPETTGYAVPTLLTLADVLNDADYRQRASRCIDFLLSVQLPCGGFPALEIADNRTEPSPFNSAQIVHGLHQWHLATGDARVIDPIVRASRWICDVQDEDGAWRRYFYRQLACTYSAYAACWLADVGVDLNEPRLLTSAERNLRWVLSQRDAETGWFDRAGFCEADHRARRAHTHTIAYTLDGVLRMSERLNVAEGCGAVRAAAERILERLERSKTLAGVLNHRWQPQASYVCLSGNAQMALVWLRLARTNRDLRFVNAAFKAIDEVKRALRVAHLDDGIGGGVPGSWPIGGDYVEFAFPNWAAKFFIDALCAKRSCLTAWIDDVRRPVGTSVIDSSARASVPSGGGGPIVVYTTRISPTFTSLATRWRRRGFAPSMVVVEVGRRARTRRLLSRLRRRADDAARLCRRYGWAYLCAEDANQPEAIAVAERVRPLVAVAAGAGILRTRILSVPALGTLNAHMGLLPTYRGMNVCEWAALNGDPIGCSVLWVDAGIDTGPIIATRLVDADGCRSIAELRARVNDSQLELLDETLQMLVERGHRVPAVPQRLDDGRQYFRMHPDLLRIVQASLRQGDRSPAQV
jgi:folate-dependent phosphoribosylglycinamide formyltransferase PurN